MTQKRLKELLFYNEKTGIFRWKVRKAHRIKIGDIAGCKGQDGYIIIRIDGKYYQIHRLAWLCMYGKFPEQEIDHINHNRSDNRICNLREVSHLENSKNQLKFKNNTSGVSGVYWSKLAKKWRVQLQVNGIRKHLGYFNDINEAKKAREEAKIKFGFHPNHA